MLEGEAFVTAARPLPPPAPGVPTSFHPVRRTRSLGYFLKSSSLLLQVPISSSLKPRRLAPAPPLSDPGVQVPSPASSDPGVQAPSPLLPQTQESRPPAPSFLRPGSPGPRLLLPQTRESRPPAPPSSDPGVQDSSPSSLRPGSSGPQTPPPVGHSSAFPSIFMDNENTDVWSEICFFPPPQPSPPV